MSASAFIFTFVPLFIVIDPLGNVPIVLALTEGMTPQYRRKVVNIALLTATVVGLAFLFFGRFILNVLGISVGAFAIAGGTVLFILSINYMVTGRFVEVGDRQEMVAVVPIGTPLLMGPATITALLLLGTQYKIYMVLISLVLNLGIAYGIFLAGSRVAAFFGRGGLLAISKVFALLLAAIGVSMVIRGLNFFGLNIGG